MASYDSHASDESSAITSASQPGIIHLILNASTRLDTDDLVTFLLLLRPHALARVHADRKPFERIQRNAYFTVSDLSAPDMLFFAHIVSRLTHAPSHLLGRLVLKHFVTSSFSVFAALILFMLHSSSSSSSPTTIYAGKIYLVLRFRSELHISTPCERSPVNASVGFTFPTTPDLYLWTRKWTWSARNWKSVSNMRTQRFFSKCVPLRIRRLREERLALLRIDTQKWRWNSRRRNVS